MPRFLGDRLYKCSTVAEMGDHLATINMGRKVGEACAIFGKAAFHSPFCRIRQVAPICSHKTELECGPMPNVMVTLPNIGSALCSMPHTLADAQYSKCRAVTLPVSYSHSSSLVLLPAALSAPCQTHTAFLVNLSIQFQS